MVIHGIIIDSGGDLIKTLDSMSDCENIDYLTYKRNDGDLSKIINSGHYYTILDKDSTIEKTINRLVEMTDSDYVLIINSGETVDYNEDIKITKAVDYYVNTLKKKLAMVKPTKDLNKLLFNTNIFRWILGWGEQIVYYLQFIKPMFYFKLILFPYHKYHIGQTNLSHQKDRNNEF